MPVYFGDNELPDEVAELIFCHLDCYRDLINCDEVWPFLKLKMWATFVMRKVKSSWLWTESCNFLGIYPAKIVNLYKYFKGHDIPDLYQDIKSCVEASEYNWPRGFNTQPRKIKEEVQRDSLLESNDTRFYEKVCIALDGHRMVVWIGEPYYRMSIYNRITLLKEKEFFLHNQEEVYSLCLKNGLLFAGTSWGLTKVWNVEVTAELQVVDFIEPDVKSVSYVSFCCDILITYAKHYPYSDGYVLTKRHFTNPNVVIQLEKLILKSAADAIDFDGELIAVGAFNPLALVDNNPSLVKIYLAKNLSLFQTILPVYGCCDIGCVKLSPGFVFVAYSHSLCVFDVKTGQLVRDVMHQKFNPTYQESLQTCFNSEFLVALNQIEGGGSHVFKVWNANSLCDESIAEEDCLAYMFEAPYDFSLGIEFVCDLFQIVVYDTSDDKGNGFLSTKHFILDYWRH